MKEFLIYTVLGTVVAMAIVWAILAAGACENEGGVLVRTLWEIQCLHLK